MKFGIGAPAVGATLAAAATSLGLGGMLDNPQPRPVPRKQPRKATVVERVMSQIVGGLTGDAFVTHIESPKPKGKRARRRERGRLKGEARLARARNQQSFSNFAKLL